MTYKVETPKKGNKQFIQTTRNIRQDPSNATWDDVIRSPRGKVIHEKETPSTHEVVTTTKKAAKEVMRALKNDHENSHEKPAKIKGMSIKEHQLPHWKND